MGTGGMRYGAGRPGWKRRTESAKPLDIRKLARFGCLGTHQLFGWQWTNGNGEQIASIGIETQTDPVRVVLSYQWTPYGKESRNVFCPISVTQTPCNFGGTRHWFRCPRCWRRAAVLYFGGADFACRRCLNLAYSSQSLNTMGRLWRKQLKIERRLADGGEEWNGWEKPQRMHWRTFSRAVHRIEEIEVEKDRVIVLVASKLMGIENI